MSFDALVKLRDDIGDMLGRQAAEMRKQLSRFTGSGVGGTDVGVSDVEDAGRDLVDGRCQCRAHLRSDLKAVRSSSVKSWGCSQAAKWPPRSTRLKWMRLSG